VRSARLRGIHVSSASSSTRSPVLNCNVPLALQYGSDRFNFRPFLLKAHTLHSGLYRRVADKLGVDSSYVSRVATGQRLGPKIRRALLDELHEIQRSLRVKGRSASGEV
jgi:hypothetical protein